jgi:hypothetical protein
MKLKEDKKRIEKTPRKKLDCNAKEILIKNLITMCNFELECQPIGPIYNIQS